MLVAVYLSRERVVCWRENAFLKFHITLLSRTKPRINRKYEIAASGKQVFFPTFRLICCNLRSKSDPFTLKPFSFFVFR